MKNASAVEPQVSEPDGVDADASTRHRVATTILRNGPSTAVALAELLDLTPAAIRRHLGVLLERGLVDSREQRVYGQRGRGRPAKVFFLTDAGRADFYQAYDDLAIAALEYLAEQAGEQAVSAFAATRMDELREVYAAARADAPDAAPTDVLTEALTRAGFVATVRPAMAGEQICQHHCPVAHVAERFPELCEAETRVFSELLGSHVQRLATIAHGDGVCTTHVPRLDQGGRSNPPRSAHQRKA